MLLILLLLLHLTVISKQKSNVLAILQPDLDSWPFAWCVRLLHILRQIIMSHNLVIEINKKLTLSKISTQIAFHRDVLSKTTICNIIPLLMQEPSPSLCLNLISMLRLAGQAICRGKSWQVQRAPLAEKVTNRVLRRAEDRVDSFSTGASQNLASCNYILVEKSLVAFAIFRGQCQDTP